jgi:hypothetical protein
MKKFNTYAFIAIIGVFLFLLVCKAVKLPVTNDEAPAAVGYLHYSAWQIMMYPDSEPNNHILNTLFTKLFISMFGNKQLVIRLPNLLFFVLYGIAIFRINKIVLKEDSVFFLPAALLFISNPYLLDFFALCRGYGMSCALATLSLSYLISGYRNERDRPVWIAYLLSFLASYANFTLLVFWCATSVMVGLYFMIKLKKQIRQIIMPVVMMVIFTLLYLALIANPMTKLHRADAFQFWTSKGFYWDTIYPFIEYSRDGSHLILNPSSHLIAAFIFMTIAANCIYIFMQLRKSDDRISILRQSVFVTTALLLLTASINIIQCHVLKTPNLHGRTALFLYPLFIAVFVSFLGLLPAVKARLVQAVLALCFSFICIFHMADRFKFMWVRNWWHDANTFEVLDYLKNQHSNELVTLKTSWMCYNSFYYYVYTGKVPWLRLEWYDKSIDINTPAEYYYIFTEDTGKLVSKFKPVQKFGNDRILLKRKAGD